MREEKDLAVREFTRWSESYDRSILQWLLFGPSHRALVRRIRETMGDRPLKVLDIGCGTGVFAALVRRELPGAVVWGVDLVGGMLSKGRARWREHQAGVLPVQGDSENLPFDSGVFDVVTCANSFHHYPRQDRAVREMGRVLKPGGRLFLVDGYRDGLWGWFIYDVCVATVEGRVHHASARRFLDLVGGAGLGAAVQTAHHNLAPFLMTEGVAGSGMPEPHFRRSRTGAAHDARSRD